MTARFLHSFPTRNALRVVKQNQKMTIVTCILYLLGIPMIMGSLMLELIFDSNRDKGWYYDINPGLYCMIGGFCLSIAVFMGMIAAINSFTELHSKSKVDMLYSLPLTGRQRFFSDFIGGCCIYILPYVISVILGWVVTLVMGSLVNWNSSNISGGTFSEICRYYALVTFGLLALMLLYFALSSLITICCGTLFESIYTNILLNLLIPGTLAAVMGVIAGNVDLDFEYMWQAIGFVSPVGGLIYLVYLISDPYEYIASYSYWRTFAASQAAEHEMLPAYLRWICVIVVLAALLVIAAWQLYVRRKAEHVGKPFVYLAAYYVMLTAVTVLILCLMSVDVIGPALLFAAIVYFVMEVIRKRGFRRFWLTIVTYVVTVGVSVGMFMLVVFTDCFGRVQYVPPSATVNSVKLECELSLNSDTDVVLEYTDRDIITAVTRLHKSIVDARRKNDPVEELNKALTEQKLLELEFGSSSGGDSAGDYYLSAPYYFSSSRERSGLSEYEYLWSYETDESVSAYFSAVNDGAVGRYVSTTELEISYYTITGSIVHRSYDLLPDEYMQLMEIIQGTELYAQACGEGLESSMEQQFRAYNNDTRQYEIPVRGTLRIGVPNNSYNTSDASSQSIDIVHPQALMDKLGEAYRNDLAAMTAEQFRTSPIQCVVYGVPVYEACTETLTVLREYGFEDFTLAERYRRSGDNYGYSDYGYSVYAYAVRIYAPGTYASASLDYPCSKLGGFYVKNDADGTPAYQDYYLAAYAGNIDDFYPELTALMEAAQMNYAAAEDCYALVVNGIPYIVPAEHSDLAEAVIEKGDLYATQLPWWDDENLYDDYDDYEYYDDDYHDVDDGWDNWQDWDYGTSGGGAFVPANGDEYPA